MHYKMKGSLTVESPAEFDAWYAEASADGKRRFDAGDAEAQWGWDFELNGLSPTTTTALGEPGAATDKHGGGEHNSPNPHGEAK
jgi:hypothetical protein